MFTSIALRDPTVVDGTDEAVFAYERRSAKRIGVDHSIAFAYARHALSSLLTAAGLGRGDEVVLSPLTCKVVPLALLSIGVRPRYADISEDTFNLDPACVGSAIGPSARAILFQHTYGNPGGIEAVAALARERGLWLFEDCAQCLPCSAADGAPGTRGDAAIFSNNLRKPLPAAAGGLAVTNDGELAGRVAALRDRCAVRSMLAEACLLGEAVVHERLLRPSRYWVLYEMSRRFRSGYKPRALDQEIETEISAVAFRISRYQARRGVRWLERLDVISAHKSRCCAAYAAALRDVSRIRMPLGNSPLPLYYFPVLVERKEELLARARASRIELVAWPLRTPIYPVEDERELTVYGYGLGSCPVAERVGRGVVGLPTDLSTGPAEIGRVVRLLAKHHAGR